MAQLTHNEFGQRLAPWPARVAAADAIRRMWALRQAGCAPAEMASAPCHEPAGVGVATSSHLVRSLTAGGTAAPGQVLPPAVDVRSTTEPTASVARQPTEAHSSLLGGGESTAQRKRTRQADTENLGLAPQPRCEPFAPQDMVKSRRCSDPESETTFYDAAVLVVHNALPCVCVDCSSVRAQLEAQGAFCPRSRLLRLGTAEKRLDFLSEASTFIVVHAQVVIETACRKSVHMVSKDPMHPLLLVYCHCPSSDSS